jgi:hypothetical protein
VLDTLQRPPWPFAIASTIARPSPTPPAARVRAASARPNRSKIRSSASWGTPQPSSSTSMTTSPERPGRARSSIASRSTVYLTAFSRSASSAARSRSGSTGQASRDERPEAPRARCDLGPAHEHVLEERLELDLAAVHEVGLISGREQQQTFDDCVDPPELVERDLELGGVLLAGTHELEVPARDRDGRSQLVRRVVDEALLALEHRAPLLGPAFGDPLSLDAPAGVPHHRQEHRGHQRHLEQLAPQLAPVERVERDRRGGRDHHAGEHDQRRASRPHPEAVDERQADPDEVERDRLPARPGDHRGVVDDREQKPEQLDVVAAEPCAHAPHAAAR